MATKKQSPKALRANFSPQNPTTWYVHIKGMMYGTSADVKKIVYDAIHDAAKSLPGAMDLQVTAQTEGGRE